MISRHIIITGKVQGVFFRKNAKQKAEELRLSGWVKNTPDDKVELLVQGNDTDINKYIEWCKKGPPKAKVDNVYVEAKEKDNSLNEFIIVYED